MGGAALAAPLPAPVLIADDPRGPLPVRSGPVHDPGRLSLRVVALAQGDPDPQGIDRGTLGLGARSLLAHDPFIKRVDPHPRAKA